MKLKYIGQPETVKGRRPVKHGDAVVMEEFVVGEKGDGPSIITKYGLTFEKNGAPVDVPDTVNDPNEGAVPNPVLAKLLGSRHFVEADGGSPAKAAGNRKST